MHAAYWLNLALRNGQLGAMHTTQCMLNSHCVTGSKHPGWHAFGAYGFLQLHQAMDRPPDPSLPCVCHACLSLGQPLLYASELMHCVSLCSPCPQVSGRPAQWAATSVPQWPCHPQGQPCSRHSRHSRSSGGGGGSHLCKDSLPHCEGIVGSITGMNTSMQALIAGRCQHSRQT
jgi:hypothetical protein